LIDKIIAIDGTKKQRTTARKLISIKENWETLSIEERTQNLAELAKMIYRIIALQ
jgi:hypothetical protein